MEFLTELGFIGLFISAFLAATILPLSSEIVLSTLLISDTQLFSPIPLIITATAGNVLGSLLNYYLGRSYGRHAIKHWLKISDRSMANAEQRFHQYGLASLCFAWVPIIGDPLTVIAGLLRVNIVWFIVLVGAGKLLRYLTVSYIILQAV